MDSHDALEYINLIEFKRQVLAAKRRPNCFIAQNLWDRSGLCRVPLLTVCDPECKHYKEAIDDLSS